MIPYSVDASLEERPWANWTAFGAVILASAIKWKLPEAATEPLLLHRWSLLGLFTYSWLHANLAHFVLNMLFLWPFGNAVCGKIGNKAYIAVFLGFNLAGGILHMLFSSSSAVAPCAAIAAIVGMYLVLFPENTIGCFFLLPRPVIFDVPGGFIIFVWFVVDLVATFWGVGVVNYSVHILGFAGGMGLAILMLKRGWVTMHKDEKSLLQMLSRAQAEEEKEPKEGAAAEEPVQQPFPETPQPAAETAPSANIISFSCQCGRRIKVPSEYAGKLGRCPACKLRVRIPKQ